MAVHPMGPWTPDQGPQPDVGVVRQAFPGFLFEALLVRPLVTADGQSAHTEEDEGREYQGGNGNFKNIHLKSSVEIPEHQGLHNRCRSSSGLMLDHRAGGH